MNPRSALKMLTILLLVGVISATPTGSQGLSESQTPELPEVGPVAVPAAVQPEKPEKEDEKDSKQCLSPGELCAGIFGERTCCDPLLCLPVKYGLTGVLPTCTHQGLGLGLLTFG